MPRLYSELASWWPLLSPPGPYGEEVAFFRQVLGERAGGAVQTVLELGSGGGNNASHMKAFYEMTLVDLSEGMLAVSRGLNPECEHVQGDMRTVRLGRLFDAVFVHDAIDYMTSEADLGRAMATAYVHCREGGLALFVPDYTCETFKAGTVHGGEDGEGRALRYLEWTFDPDPGDTTYIVDFAYLLREGDERVRVEYDRHVCGLFGREVWLRLLEEVRFEAEVVPDPFGRELFVARKDPADAGRKL